ncbi:hypothetical protein ACTFIZ_009583 [Dictyostelium cf. discoideum]
MNNKSINIILIFFLINSFVTYTTSTTTSTTTIYVSNLNSKLYEGTSCGDSINTPCVNLNDAFEKLKSLASQKNYPIIEIEILNNKPNKEYKATSKLEIVNENLSFSINGGLESTIIDITDFQDSFINIIKTNVTTESTINNNNNNNFNFTNLTFKRNLNFSLPSSTKIRPTLFNIVNIKNLLFNNIEIILNNNTIHDDDDDDDDDDEYDNKSIIQETAFFNFTNSNVKFSDCSIPSNKPIIGKDSTIEINFSNFTLDLNNLNSCYPCQYKINQSIDINNNNNNYNKNDNNNKHKNNNSEYKENLIILSITISFSIIIVITATYKLYNKYRLYKTLNLSKSNNNNNNNNNNNIITSTTKTSGGGINLLKNIISKKTNSDYIKLEAIKSGDNITSINSE